MENPEIEVIVATMHDKAPVCLADFKDAPQNVALTIINQSDKEGEVVKDNVRWINTKSRGLSKSRNIGIKIATSNLCLLSDNDVFINFKKLGFIAPMINKEDVGCVVCGNISDVGFNTNKLIFLNKRKALKVCSWQIILNRKRVKDIFFDERFGLGSDLNNSGEENIYLTDILRKGIKIIAIPSKLIDHRDSGTGGIIDDNFYRVRINVFKRIFGSFIGYMIYILFLLKKKIEMKDISLSMGIYYLFKD